jgi:hypothetical protein
MSEGWKVVAVEFGDVHVVPLGEDHELTAQCWCGPTFKDEHYGLVQDERLTLGAWVHHARDRREHTVERQ